MKSASNQTAHFLDHEKSLACIHCGLCLSSCPTYLETGDENNSPRGRIYLMRALEEGRLPVGPTTVRPIDLCLGCRACEATCPSGVQYGQLLEQTRDHIESHYRRSLFQRFLRRIAIEKIFPFPTRLKFALGPAKLVKFLRAERLLPKFLREAISLIPDHANGAALPEVSPALTDVTRGRVGFVNGCVMSVMFGETNVSSVKLLNRSGYEVVTPKNQVCCGALYAHSGKLDQARESAKRNIEVFEQFDVAKIIINAAGCGSTLKEYHHLLEHDPAWKSRAVAFSKKVVDLTEFLVGIDFGVPGPERRGASLGPDQPSPSPVTYHDACHLAHAQRITKAPRELARAAAGSDFVELAESDVCCGSAGSYNLTEPEMAERLQKRKTEKILQSGAKLVVTTNPGCILQIRAGLRKAGAAHVQVLHIADYLEAIRQQKIGS